jgi:hypothetical protein
MPYCQRCVEIAPQPWNHDSRGPAHALSGDYKAAIADLEIAAAWMQQQTEEKWKIELARRKAWIETLKAGHNPLTPQVLAELRYNSKGSSARSQ